MKMLVSSAAAEKLAAERFSVCTFVGLSDDVPYISRRGHGLGHAHRTPVSSLRLYVACCGSLGSSSDQTGIIPDSTLVHRSRSSSYTAATRMLVLTAKGRSFALFFRRRSATTTPPLRQIYPPPPVIDAIGRDPSMRRAGRMINEKRNNSPDSRTKQSCCHKPRI